MDSTNPIRSSVVLLSGGLDSSVNLFWASTEHEVRAAVFVSYGQKVAANERASAHALAVHLAVRFVEIDLRWLASYSKSALTDPIATPPVNADLDLNDIQKSQQSAQAVWVPNRNGLMIHAAGVIAEALDADAIIVGFNSEEAQTFPDNSNEYMLAESRALYFSTRNHVSLHSYTVAMDKAAIVQKAIGLDLPLDLIWSCYQDGVLCCQQCESCLRFARALAANGVAHPDWRLGSSVSTKNC